MAGDIVMSVKECSICKQLKDTKEFGNNVRLKDGFMSTCKGCISIRNRTNRLKYVDKFRADARRRRQKVTDFGAEQSIKNRGRFMRRHEINYLWKVCVCYPFTFALSKNCLHRFGGGRVYTNPVARAAQAGLIMVLRNSFNSGTTKIKPVQGKVWIRIFVEKPSMRGDAINVIDTICDAIKQVIGVDDNWFCIESLDWAISKKDPHVLIEIGQETFEPERPCQACGVISKEIALRTDPFCESCRKQRIMTIK